MIKLQLVDPDLGISENVDLIVGDDIFSRAVRYVRRYRLPGSPSAFKTSFEWVLNGTINTDQMEQQITTYYVSIPTGDNLHRKLREVEDCNFQKPPMSLDEKNVVKRFEDTHTRDESGRFIIPLPKKANVIQLGESRSKAAKRLLNLKQSLTAKRSSSMLIKAMHEYFETGHAEPVPAAN